MRRDLSRSGHYDHTPEEIAFGARVAWRNHGRCIGRLFWESLEVADCRTIIEPEAMAGRVADHMGEALGDGRVRSIISVFAPVEAGRLPAYLESQQITQYAGHAMPDGTILGDRQNVEATRIARSLGWRPPGEPGRFDLLPFLIRDAADRRMLFSLPEGAVREVPIRHSGARRPRGAGPALVRGAVRQRHDPDHCGIDYPCAPFNGFYMGTEIASRNFVDVKRYDLLPDIARAFGLDAAAPGTPLWRDTALTELNRAVLALLPRRPGDDGRPPRRERPVHGVPPARAGPGAPRGRRLALDRAPAGVQPVRGVPPQDAETSIRSRTTTTTAPTTACS